MHSETFHVLEYHEFDKLVNEHLKPPQEYEVVPDQEWNNDESHTFSISPDDYSDDDQKELQEFLRGEVEQWMSPAVLLGELAARGVIPWGEYLIEVCW